MAPSTATPSGAIPTATSAETPRSVVAEAPAPSASSRTTFGFIAAVMAFASIFVSL
ncbi:hypothetical protein TSUD_313500 [Trifolium subterraneum]|uniref:Uncharacterized protein n=1 Tax=Trifolium subterraneum TaxID=3900 RepID=A0A2Z6M8K7_TRISU|nr:hypothetical protein TSUD_313500 [Trifolium subterraneum]